MDRSSLQLPDARPGDGTGSHTVLRRILTGGLGVPAERIRVVHVPTHELPSDRGDRESVLVDVDEDIVDEDVGADVTSYCVQVADVAEVLNPVARRVQLDGGTAMGYGFACLEDLHVEDGQVWSGTPWGEFKLPSIRDLPVLRTVLVPGGRGLGPLNIKSAG